MSEKEETQPEKIPMDINDLFNHISKHEEVKLGSSKDVMKEIDESYKNMFNLKKEPKITSITDVIHDLMNQFLAPALKASISSDTKKEETEIKKEETDAKKEEHSIKQQKVTDIFNGIMNDILAPKKEEINKQEEANMTIKHIEPERMLSGFSGLFSLGAETMYKTKYNNLMNIINFFSTVKDINAFVTYAKEHGMDIIKKEDSLFSSDVDTLKFIYTKMENEDGSGVSQR